MPAVPAARTGQVTDPLAREQFRSRYLARFYDPAFREAAAEIDKLEAIAWQAYSEGRKSPLTAKAGAGYHDPDYDLSVEWRAAHDRILAAEKRQQDPATLSRVLVINASPRNDYTCPGEMSKSFRLLTLVEQTLQLQGLQVDRLDLSRLTSDPDLHIHPCKGCVSTAMPLCHWPCSCYPNHSLGQVNDIMNDVYERFAACHGVVFITPTHWFQVSSPLKLLMDRLVCADGGNPDPTSTHGKKNRRSQGAGTGWLGLSKHLAGRAYGVLVHGDVAGIEGTRRALTDWLDWMGLVESGSMAKLDRYIGYYEPYATNHETFDQDAAIQEEARNLARAVANAVKRIRAGEQRADAELRPPRPK